MRTITLIINGQPVTVQEPTFLEGKTWRAAFEAELETFLAQVDLDLGQALQEVAGLTIPTTVEEYDPAELDRAAGIVQRLLPGLGSALRAFMASQDTLADLIFTYGPDLTERRAELEPQIYPDELPPAFWVIVRAAYPFLSVTQLIQKLGSAAGQITPLTSKNSPEANNRTAAPAKAES